MKKKEAETHSKMDLDTFGKLMDEFIEKNHVQMLIDMPEGTNEPVVKDNTGLGPVIQFYILLAAIKPIYIKMAGLVGVKRDEQLIDGVLDLVKGELMEAAEEQDGQTDI